MQIEFLRNGIPIKSPVPVVQSVITFERKGESLKKDWVKSEKLTDLDFFENLKEKPENNLKIKFFCCCCFFFSKI